MISRKKVIIGGVVVVSIIAAVIVLYYAILPNSPLKNAGVSGIYDSTNPAHAGSYVELRSDGTAFFYYKYDWTEASGGSYGTWELREGNRIFATTSQGAAGYFRIDGNDLIDEQGGEVYVKHR
jgi:hypothetical protein